MYLGGLGGGGLGGEGGGDVGGGLHGNFVISFLVQRSAQHASLILEARLAARGFGSRSNVRVLQWEGPTCEFDTRVGHFSRRSARSDRSVCCDTQGEIRRG